MAELKIAPMDAEGPKKNNVNDSGVGFPFESVNILSVFSSLILP